MVLCVSGERGILSTRVTIAVCVFLLDSEILEPGRQSIVNYSRRPICPTPFGSDRNNYRAEKRERQR